MSVGRNLKLQGALVILAATLIGVAGGVFMERSFGDTPRRFRPEMGDRQRRGGFEPGRPGPFPREFEALDLTPEQRTRIDSIFQAWQPRTDSVMSELLPRVRGLRDSVRIAIDSVLTPEQREKMRNLMPPNRGRRGDRPDRRPPRL